MLAWPSGMYFNYKYLMAKSFYPTVVFRIFNYKMLLQWKNKNYSSSEKQNNRVSKHVSNEKYIHFCYWKESVNRIL